MFQSHDLVTLGVALGIANLIVVAAIFVIAAFQADSTSPATSWSAP